MTVKRVLIAAPLMPEFDRESGSQRIFDLIMLLREEGWAVSFVAENGRGGERYAQLLQQRGIAVYDGFGERIERLLTRGRLDLVIFAFWHLAEAQMHLVRRLSPKTRIIVDTIDLHFLREARRLFQSARGGDTAAAGNSNGALDAGYGSKMIRELNTYAAADGVLAVSLKEADLIGDLSDEPNLAHLVPDCEDAPVSTVSPEDRCGITFIGNFRHPPNISAAEFFCQKVVPRIHQKLLARHPVYVVGNALGETIPGLAQAHPAIRMVGWVPSVLPYLQRAKISVVPLLYGAGTKRKILQALTLGTPTVSTTAGVEGLGLRHGEHVMVADDPDAFAGAIERLLRDTQLWKQLARQGREHVIARHGRDVVRRRLLEAISVVLSKPARKSAPKVDAAAPPIVELKHYQEMVERVRQAMVEAIPEGSTVAVISRGDPELLKVTARCGWHFPQDERGTYAGHYPRDSAAAIRQVESVRQKGAGFLVFPHTAAWWLDHYAELKDYLERNYSEVMWRDGTCVIFDLRDGAAQAADKDISARAFNRTVPRPTEVS
jgi:glycosyltransferase involved in cell wall biosynthesis